MTKKHILIVGGGFGGVKAAMELSKSEQCSVTLLSEHMYFRYYPTLYHTATGGLRSQSSIPLQEIVGDQPVHLEQGRAAKLDRQRRTIVTDDGRELTYDILILGLGVMTNYFGIKGLAEYSYGIKSLEEAEKFKTHLHQQLSSEHKPDLHYVVVGAGPTGIELAGALPEYLHTIMQNHGIRHRAVHVDLIEAAPRLLPRSSKPVSRAVRRRLRKLGVQLYLGQSVQGETADALMVNGKPIRSHTVIWTAGMTNNPFFRANNFNLNERGKVVVDDYLQAEPGIYVIGDNAATPYSGMAQTALHDADFVSQHLLRQFADVPPRPYKSKKPVSVIPAGPEWAAVEWGKLHFYGRLGWLLRLAADWIAFHDYEPWWRASKQWMNEFGGQESCPTCATSHDARIPW